MKVAAMTGRAAVCLALVGVVAGSAAGATPKPAVARHAKAPQQNAGDEAARALFVRSDVEGARALAAKALAGHRAAERDAARALFVEMEAAALAADTSAMLEAAL